jgi:DNA-binding PadR family transcriptional regulator
MSGDVYAGYNYPVSETTREMKRMYDLSAFQRDLLYVIAGLDEPHGLAIKDELELYYEKNIQHGRLYPNLDTLVDKGLVDKDQKDLRTNAYTLTRRGERELQDRREWENQYIRSWEGTVEEITEAEEVSTEGA